MKAMFSLTTTKKCTVFLLEVFRGGFNRTLSIHTLRYPKILTLSGNGNQLPKKLFTRSVFIELVQRLNRKILIYLMDLPVDTSFHVHLARISIVLETIGKLNKMVSVVQWFPNDAPEAASAP